MQANPTNPNNPRNVKPSEVDIYPGVSDDLFFPPDSDARTVSEPPDSIVSLLKDIRESLNHPDRNTELDIFPLIVGGMYNTAILKEKNRTSISLYNMGPEIVFVLTNDDLSTQKGMPIPVSAEREISASQNFWLRCETGIADVRVSAEFVPW